MKEIQNDTMERRGHMNARGSRYVRAFNLICRFVVDKKRRDGMYFGGSSQRGGLGDDQGCEQPVSVFVHM